MYTSYKTLIGLLAALFFLACSSEKNTQKSSENRGEQQNEIIKKSEFPDAVAYEIFIQSFADSNGDGIGDFKGATQKLDYLADLGIQAVWLMPIMESPSYHKYDVTNYKSIHPDYGNMDDFKEFVKEAHQRGIKVIIDMIINHSGSDHPWFQEAKKGVDNPYREYYVWADKDAVADEIAKKETAQDSDNIQQWHAVEGNKKAEHYYGYFYGGMPDLNFDSEKVRKEIIDIGRFWLEEIDVDGFRLDAAKHIFPDDRVKDSYEWWQYYSEEMKKIKPDVYLVGEVWAPASLVKQFAKGLPALFNFDLAGSIQQAVIEERNIAATIEGPRWVTLEEENLVDNLIAQRKVYQAANADYHDATFLSNHDQNRIMSNLKGDVAKAKLAASILLTLPGSPYIYYGEEIGMLGMKPDPNIREPMIWNTMAVDSLRTTWMPPKFATDETVSSVAVQMEDNQSLFTHYKSLIGMRNENEALSKGELIAFPHADERILGYGRVFEGDTVYVVHNLSKDIIIPIPDFKGALIYGRDNLFAGQLNAYESMVFRE
ncbi:MAG: alpha-amylase [Marivirga sp.]|jgi:alpha-amylase